MYITERSFSHSLIFLSLVLFTSMTHAQLLDFTNAHTVNDLWVVNDGVMGGLSESRFRNDPEGALFEGTVSLENDGGFASVRSPVTVPANSAALELTVRGDEKSYKLVLRTDPSLRAPLYQAEFLTTREWNTHRFLPKDFKASFRGKSVDAPELVFSEVKEVGILIANKQAGTFSIQLKGLQAIIDTRR